MNEIYQCLISKRDKIDDLAKNVKFFCQVEGRYNIHNIPRAIEICFFLYKTSVQKTFSFAYCEAFMNNVPLLKFSIET